MKLGLHQTPRMEQRLVQSPQMIQAMQILQLSTQDLRERIEQELMENPFLELADGAESSEEEAPPAPPAESAERASEQEAAGVESMLEELERYERDFGDGRMRQRDDGEGDKKLEAMANTPIRAHSLAEALIEQLPLIDLERREREVAEYLIWSLDHKGFLPEPIEDLIALCDIEGVTVEEMEQVLHLLRDALHPALGARDLRECWLLQLESHNMEDELLRALIREHLEDVAANRLPRIARATGRSVEEVKQAIELLRTLDPCPGREYDETPSDLIHPDVAVEDFEGGYDVRLTRQRVPELTVSPSYRRLLQQAQKGDGVQEWVKKRLESARWFIDAVHQRQNTMLKISKAIFERQRDFLDRGVQSLHALRMQEIADEVGVHISTVSRAVAGKYAQTPRGIYPLKYFFTSGTAKTSGEVASQVSIKHRIKAIVGAEDPQVPLSDDQIAAALEEREGIRIARRTVTKYRKALSIPSSSQRRQF